MATKIIHKKSSVASSVPAAGDLEAGELAINLTDKKLYSKTTGGTVITVGTSDYNDLENLPTIPDTSTLMPKAGGTFTGSITMEDGDQINVGTSNDLVLSHNNTSAGSLVSYTGDMTVKANSGIMEVSGSSVKLQRLGATVLEAYSGTVDVTGNIVVSGTVDGVDIASRDAVLTSTTTTANAAMPKSGGTFTGDVSFQTSGLGNPILIDHSHDKMFFPQGKDLAFGSGSTTNTMSIKYDGTRNVFTNLSANPIRFDGNTEVIGTLGVNNAYSLPTADGTSGQVLTTDGSGGVTFADAGGASELNDLSDGVGNTTTDNYGAGRDVLGDITTGTENTAFGALAGQQITTGGSNTFYGRNAGRFVTTGSYNVGIGLNAASGTNLDKQTGDYNIGIGWNAGNAVISTDKNTAVGYNADNTGNPAGSTAIGSDAVAAGDRATALTNSYASGTDSFAAAIGDNTSSYGATGANSVAIGYQAKATNSYAFAGGSLSTASGYGSISIGISPTASGHSSIALGGRGVWNAQATAQSSIAIGDGARSAVKGKMAFAGYGMGNAGSQGAWYTLYSDTTDATAEAMTTTKSTASSDNQIILQNESAISFSGTVVCREDATDGDDYAGWEVKGVIMRQGAAADTTLGVGIVNKLYSTSGISAADVALSADTTNGGLKVEVTGVAATNLRWVATINASEVIYA